MKKNILHACLLLVVSLVFTGCYYDKENELYPTGPTCDTTGTMTYTTSIAPIMTGNCNVCHSTANPQGGIITDNYTDLSNLAKGGQLWPAVNHENGIAMPKGADKLSTCDLTKIKKWIDGGTP